MFFEISASSPEEWPEAGNPGSVSPSLISLLHSIPCNTMNAAPKAMVASSQFRVQALSRRWAANTAITMVSELDSRHAVMMVELMMLSFANGVGQDGIDTRL